MVTLHIALNHLKLCKNDGICLPLVAFMGEF